MVRTNPIKQRYGKTPPKGDIVPMTNDMGSKPVNKDIKSIFKLDSAENIANKLIHGNQDSNMVGASGGLGLIAGVAGNVVKSLPKLGAFFNTARQYLSRSLGKTPPVTNFKPLVTGNKVHNTESINKAFSTRFNTPPTTPKHLQSYSKEGLKNLQKEATVNPAAKTFLETGKTPTQVYKETGKNTTKELEAYFAKKYDGPSGYYTPDAKLMGGKPSGFNSKGQQL